MTDPSPVRQPGFEPGAASNAELLAQLLFEPPPGPRALRSAQRLLERAGSLRALLASQTPGGPLERSIRARLNRLPAAVELVRRSLAEHLGERPSLASPEAVRHFLCLWLRERPSECFAVLFLDTQNRLITAQVMFQGSVSQTVVHPREVARRALELNAAALIVAHNHPSGVAEPSMADRMLTDGLRSALKTLDLPVLDHLIVGGNRCFSFAESGLLRAS
jgi:DNA repair protein RadC